MRRPIDRVTACLMRLVVRLVVLFVLGYAGLCLMLPGWLGAQLHEVAGDALTVGQIRLGFPATLIASDVRLVYGQPRTIVSSDRIIIKPAWVSWPDKVVSIKQLEFQGLHLSYRRTRQGTLVQPSFEPLLDFSTRAAISGRGSSQTEVAAAPPGAKKASSWRAVIQTIQISEGTLEVVDQKSAKPFRGALTHIFLAAGPMMVPFDPLEAQPVILAVHGLLIGHAGYAAPVYCSGWVDARAKNVDLACQLEPLRLAAAEPYYPGLKYDATLKVASHLVATANRLEGRIQLEISQLSDADLALLEKALGSLKKFTGGAQPALTGEMQVSGSLDEPSDWRFYLVPGNEIVQHLVKPLLDHGIEIIDIKVGKQMIPIGLMPSTETTKADSEAAKQHVQEALQIIAPASPPFATPVMSAPAASATGASSPQPPASAVPNASQPVPPIAVPPPTNASDSSAQSSRATPLPSR